MLLPTLVVAVTATFGSSTAQAAPSRIALLGPSEAPIAARLERNVASLKLDTLRAAVTVCSRDVVTRLIDELYVDTALCTDEDQISVWMKDGDRLVLEEAVVVQSDDERAQELAAARATMALQALAAKGATTDSAAPSSLTIVTHGPSARIVAGDDPAALPAPSPPTKDEAAPPRPTPKPERIALRLVLGAGPALAASRHGNSLAISAEAEIGVSPRRERRRCESPRTSSRPRLRRSSSEIPSPSSVARGSSTSAAA